MKNISIILVKPQMGENIGATARVMKNFGITDLRIIAPRDGWPNERATAMSAHAGDIVAKAKIFETIADAVADMNMVFATAAKSRDMEKPLITPEQAADISFRQQPAKVGFMFGRESSGLDNNDISYANYHVSIPVSAEYTSLNLAQAVCVMCYEMFKKYPEQGSRTEVLEPLSARKDIHEMLSFMERELDNKGFFQVAEKKAGMMINIRNIFTRGNYTEQEVRTLRGIFNAMLK